MNTIQRSAFTESTHICTEPPFTFGSIRFHAPRRPAATTQARSEHILLSR